MTSYIQLYIVYRDEVSDSQPSDLFLEIFLLSGGIDRRTHAKASRSDNPLEAEWELICMQGDYTSLGIKLKIMRWAGRRFCQFNSRQILASVERFQ